MTEFIQTFHNGLYRPLVADDTETDTDNWDGGDDNPENFGALPGHIDHQHDEASVSQTILFCNEDTGVEERRWHSRLLRGKKANSHIQQLDKVDTSLCQRLEGYVVREIEHLRTEFQAPQLSMPDILRQAARSTSQYFCGNCVRDCDMMPFNAHSFTVRQSRHKSMRWHARELIRFMSRSSLVMDHLTDQSICEIGVGVWGSSGSYIVTVAVDKLEERANTTAERPLM